VLIALHAIPLCNYSLPPSSTNPRCEAPFAVAATAAATATTATATTVTATTAATHRRRRHRHSPRVPPQPTATAAAADASRRRNRHASPPLSPLGQTARPPHSLPGSWRRAVCRCRRCRVSTFAAISHHINIALAQQARPSVQPIVISALTLSPVASAADVLMDPGARTDLIR